MPERTVEAAQLVAGYWHRAANERIERDDNSTWATAVAHSMSCVLAALQGETDPDQLGIDVGPERDALLTMRSAGGAS